jgi:hypothetical protein
LKTKRKVCGVGINDSPTPINKRNTLPHPKGKQIQKTVWACPFYIVWADMLKRCYSPKYLAKYPSYKGCTVCEEWLHFSKFKSWMEQQDWESKELDKDIMVEGNKTYSPNTCLFVSKEVNYIFLAKACMVKQNLLGVRETKSGKYKASCKNGNVFLYSVPLLDEMDAHNEWKRFKVIAIKRALESQTDERVIGALESRILKLQKSIIEGTEVKWL